MHTCREAVRGGQDQDVDVQGNKRLPADGAMSDATLSGAKRFMDSYSDQVGADTRIYINIYIYIYIYIYMYIYLCIYRHIYI